MASEHESPLTDKGDKHDGHDGHGKAPAHSPIVTVPVTHPPGAHLPVTVLPSTPAPVAAARLKAVTRAEGDAAQAAKASEGSPADKAPTPPGGRKANKVAATGQGAFYRCHLPADPTVPARVVQAQTPGDAERVYREESGVVTFGHPVSVAPSDAAPHAE